MTKKGIFFSLDALIALSIILFAILIIYPLIRIPEKQNTLVGDTLAVFSNLKIGEMAENNAYVQGLITSGKITNTQKSILEQIGEFYVTDRAQATNLAYQVLDQLKTNENIGIWIGTTLIASKNSTSYNSDELNEINSQRQVISGIRNDTMGESATGYSARAFLSSSLNTKYFYFGGYIGEGEITAPIDFNGTITSMKLEIVTNKDFKLYIDDNFAGIFNKSYSEFEPVIYSLDNYINLIQPGKEKVTFTFKENESTDKLHIVGGYIRISYVSDIAQPIEKRYNFPGINGIINLYDGLDVPGTLNSMNIFLHFNNSIETTLKLGNTILINASVSNSSSITLSNSELSSKLNYSFLSNKTTPLRLGMKNISFKFNKSRELDVFSVVDLSGSMCEGQCWTPSSSCTSSSPYNNESNCVLNTGSWDKLGKVKEANKIFIASILNKTTSRVGLVSYDTSDRCPTDCHDLSDNYASLNNKINTWTDYSSTCICCGINEAITKFINGTGIIIDNTNSSCTRTGTWTSSTSPSGYYGSNYVHDRNQLKGSKTAKYTPTISKAGNYKVYMWYSSSSGRATNVPVDIVSSSGTSTIYVNQIVNGSKWNLLGDYYFNAGTSGYVTIRTNNTNGYVVADAIMFLPDSLTSSSDSIRAMVVMSDGEANVRCNNGGTDAKSDAIQAACDAYNFYNITIHSVGFGSSGYLDEATLIAISNCGHGNYSYGNASNIGMVYKTIAETILNYSYYEQSISVSNQSYSSILYPDSYIDMNYDSLKQPFGLITTSERLFDNSTHGSFSVPLKSSIVEAKIISYSGQRWTSLVRLNNQIVYNLSSYGGEYTLLGDPYVISLPISLVQQNNTIEVYTGLGSSDIQAGSVKNKIIYTLVSNFSSYSPISSLAEGCKWTITFEDNSVMQFSVPSTYNGTNLCIYPGDALDYDSDAINKAIYRLLQKLDYESPQRNGKIDVYFTEQNIQLGTSEITGIPFIQTLNFYIRTWK